MLSVANSAQHRLQMKTKILARQFNCAIGNLVIDENKLLKLLERGVESGREVKAGVRRPWRLDKTEMMCIMFTLHSVQQ